MSSVSSSELFAAINTANGYTSSSSKLDTSTAEGMQEQFLTLLMAQLQNQDPLNPLENAELTSQLSQINMVSGIQTVNESLQSLISSFSDSQSLQAAALIGKNVLVPGNSLPLSVDSEGNTSGSLAGVVLESNADRVAITIKNKAGQVISTSELGSQKAGIVTFAWDGKDKDGNTMAAGDYSYTIEATQGGQKVGVTAMEYGTVYALTRENSGDFVLDLGDSKVSLKDVQQII